MKRRLCLGAVLVVIVSACGDAPSADTQSGLFFPTAGSNDDAVMGALFHGKLVVRNDCVLAGYGQSVMIPIWREGYTVERDDAGRVEVRDADGATVAIKGELFEMGGGYIAEFEPRNKVEPPDDQLQQVAEMTGNTIPERCLGPDVYGVWWVGSTQPLSA